MNVKNKSDLDLLQAEECVGLAVHPVLDSSIKGQVVRVSVSLSNRSYEMEWFVDGNLHSAYFFGFQLEIEDK